METVLPTLQNAELNYGRQYEVPSVFLYRPDSTQSFAVALLLVGSCLSPGAMQ